MYEIKYPFETKITLAGKECTIHVGATVHSLVPKLLATIDEAIVVAVDGICVARQDVFGFLGATHFSSLRRDLEDLTYADDHEEAAYMNQLYDHYGEDNA